MKIREIADLLDAEVLVGDEMLDTEILTACAGDMMSDVLAFPKEHMVLLTGLMNPQTMRTCDMLDVRCVVFVRGKRPADELLELAKDYDMCVLSTSCGLYVASGILYTNGLHARKKGL